MLLQDYEKGRIKGCTNNNLSFLKTNEDIDTKYYLPGHWQKLGENNEIIETKEYLLVTPKDLNNIPNLTQEIEKQL